MSGKKQPAPALPPKYPDFVTFAQKWLLPIVTVRLAEANREKTFTWCTRWWSHRSVAVRIAHLHSAFEAARAKQDAATISTFLSRHVDAHFRLILDAANGPLHRCTRTRHVHSPGLPFDPVPHGWFSPKPDQPRAGDKEPDLRYDNFTDFTEQWLLPVISVRLTGKGREGTFTWCRQWWRHRSVALRFAALHRVFEGSCRSEDGMAMSKAFVDHIDPHMRWILDAANGPLHRCAPEHHNDIASLPFAPVPEGWFAPDAIVPVEDRGFGPDFRSLADHPW